mmetsp:Transcript_6437/g.14081  ORF Transcript_6437/g.14081 Transcript_6437/m.14081 type:complete len:425 (-) Transcript_6437:70-1344(-)|eukprot:CAMPEP_0178388562 /NCGR_PEP_ID=MMETSP0689_2-20121128/9660_1 /TAXON_ID=160604 /ORGANISM="Amphidinium massartii, Strain CS-259" /LENGTH=424 /DNA_ID=CAMNT_0020008975 /DNA_START=129 /DNA_END=1403 /DNA_ORIENTATION=+
MLGDGGTSAEKQPLLAAEKAPEKSVIQKLQDHGKTLHEAVFPTHEVRDAMTYQASKLSSWNSLLVTSHTVWCQRSLWMMALKLFAFSMVVALLVLILIPDPSDLKVSRFADIVEFLRIFVGLLLGFFMSASVQRWWSCAEGFMQLFDAIRCLQIQFISLGVPEDRCIHCLRYGVLSGWILSMQLEVEALPERDREEAHRKNWENLRVGLRPHKSGGGADEKLGVALPEELDVLSKTSDPSSCLWMWVGSLIGCLSMDGLIPPMASPIYGRIMQLAEQAHDAIRNVRSNISIQAPFIYVQMLASMVHINNLVNAVSFGLTAGASLGTILSFMRVHPQEARASGREASTDAQSLLSSFFFSCFGPFVYQAMLEVAIAIAQPFSHEHAILPTVHMIQTLEEDLNDGFEIAKKAPWHKPSYTEFTKKT